MKTKHIGIDLGTTNSAISILDSFGKPEIIPTDGERVTPSVVSFPADETTTVIVGGQARELLKTEPEAVIQLVKREMGSDTVYKRRSAQYTPQQISALIIKKLIEGAEKVHGKISDVVITVPANFSEASRRATIQAGEIAGVKVAHIINEPTAAALAYAASGNALSGNVMIFDLGGGTFDVTITKIDGKSVTCIASQGDSHLGGADFDHKLYELISSAYQAEHGVALPAGPDSAGEYYAFLNEAEKLKIMLTKREKGVSLIHGPKGTCKVEITRSQFEAAISGLLTKTELLIEAVLDEVKMTPKDIDYVLLVGGSTRVPAVRECLTKLMGKIPLDAVNPDEAVALGAAIYAGLKGGELTTAQQYNLQAVTLTEVANHYYGTIIVYGDEALGRLEDKVSVIIPKNMQIPAEDSGMFQTLVHNQTAIRIRITQSVENTEDPSQVNVVHEGTMLLPAGRPAGQPVKATYKYDSNQIMHCVFEDTNSGTKYFAELGPEILGSVETQAAAIKTFKLD